MWLFIAGFIIGALLVGLVQVSKANLRLNSIKVEPKDLIEAQRLNDNLASLVILMALMRQGKKETDMVASIIDVINDFPTDHSLIAKNITESLDFMIKTTESNGKDLEEVRAFLKEFTALKIYIH
jgi:hypothetical protein